MTALWAALCGVLIALGAVMAVRGALPSEPEPDAARGRLWTWARLTRRPAGEAGRRRDIRLAAGLAVGLIVWALTGWAAAVVLVPGAALLVPHLLGAPPNREVELLAALDRWVRTIAAMLPTGRSVADAVRASGRTAPELLREPLAVAIARLEERWPTRDALLAMADDLASPDADAVLAALVLAAHRGGTGATASLAALSDSIADRLSALREIEAERAKPRVVVRQVTVISLVAVGAAALFGRDFFAPYATGLGQVIVVALAGAYTTSLLLMRRLATPPVRARILRAEAGR